MRSNRPPGPRVVGSTGPTVIRPKGPRVHGPRGLRGERPNGAMAQGSMGPTVRGPRGPRAQVNVATKRNKSGRSVPPVGPSGRSVGRSAPPVGRSLGRSVGPSGRSVGRPVDPRSSHDPGGQAGNRSNRITQTQSGEHGSIFRSKITLPSLLSL